jgi:hypothetical protein
MMLGEDWREPYINFIKDHKLPMGVSKWRTTAAHIMRRSKGLIMVKDKLYKRGAR